METQGRVSFISYEWDITISLMTLKTTTITKKPKKSVETCEKKVSQPITTQEFP